MKTYFNFYDLEKLERDKKQMSYFFITTPFIIFIISYMAFIIYAPKESPSDLLMIALTIVLLPTFLICIFAYILYILSINMKKSVGFITDTHIVGIPLKDVVKILIVRWDQWRVHGYDIYIVYKNKEKLSFKRGFFHDKYWGERKFRKFMEALECLKEDTGIDIPVEFMRDYEFKGWRKHV